MRRQHDLVNNGPSPPVRQTAAGGNYTASDQQAPHRFAAFFTLGLVFSLAFIWVVLGFV
jgi:hypothetical protein